MAGNKAENGGDKAVGFDLDNPQVLLAWQRNHLANERNFLAWVRTSLALFAFSFVIERFDFLLKRVQQLEVFASVAQKHLHTDYLSVCVFAAGVAVMLIASWRYYSARKMIDAGEKRFTSAPDAAVMGIVAALIVALFVLFLLILR